MRKQKVKHPFANLILDEEERSLETASENAKFEKDPNFVNTKAMLQEAAEKYVELHTVKPTLKKTAIKKE